MTWLPRQGITVELQVKLKSENVGFTSEFLAAFATASIGSLPARVHSRSIISIKLGLLTGVRRAPT